MLKLLGFIGSAIFIGGPAAAKTFTIHNSDRMVELIGVVGNDAIDLAADIDSMSKESSDDIYMLINSPGGAVGPGMVLVDSLRQAKLRGVKLKCAVGVLAASMAFILLSHCDERYSLPEAKLLFHPISVSTRGSRVQELVVDMLVTIKQERRIMANLRRTLEIDQPSFLKHYFAETFWAAQELANYTAHSNFLTIVNRIEGAGDNLFKYRKPGRGFFGIAGGRADEVIRRFEGK